MQGNEYACSDCDFEFCSGWSHHAGGQFIVCRCCGTKFILGGGNSCWGSQVDETLQVIRCDGSNQFLGIEVRVMNKSFMDPDDEALVPYLRFDDIPCPDCKENNEIVQKFNPDDPCPRCPTGKINITGTCIY